MDEKLNGSTCGISKNIEIKEEVDECNYHNETTVAKNKNEQQTDTNSVEPNVKLISDKNSNINMKNVVVLKPIAKLPDFKNKRIIKLPLDFRNKVAVIETNNFSKLVNKQLQTKTEDIPKKPFKFISGRDYRPLMLKNISSNIKTYCKSNKNKNSETIEKAQLTKESKNNEIQEFLLNKIRNIGTDQEKSTSNATQKNYMDEENVLEDCEIRNGEDLIDINIQNIKQEICDFEIFEEKPDSEIPNKFCTKIESSDFEIGEEINGSNHSDVAQKMLEYEELKLRLQQIEQELQITKPEQHLDREELEQRVLNLEERLKKAEEKNSGETVKITRKRSIILSKSYWSPERISFDMMSDDDKYLAMMQCREEILDLYMAIQKREERIKHYRDNLKSRTRKLKHKQNRVHYFMKKCAEYKEKNKEKTFIEATQELKPMVKLFVWSQCMHVKKTAWMKEQKNFFLWFHSKAPAIYYRFLKYGFNMPAKNTIRKWNRERKNNPESNLNNKEDEEEKEEPVNIQNIYSSDSSDSEKMDLS